MNTKISCNSLQWLIQPSAMVVFKVKRFTGFNKRFFHMIFFQEFSFSCTVVASSSTGFKIYKISLLSSFFHFCWFQILDFNSIVSSTKTHKAATPPPPCLPPPSSPRCWGTPCPCPGHARQRHPPPWKCTPPSQKMTLKWIFLWYGRWKGFAGTQFIYYFIIWVCSSQLIY